MPIKSPPPKKKILEILLGWLHRNLGVRMKILLSTYIFISVYALKKLRLRDNFFLLNSKNLRVSFGLFPTTQDLVC